MDFSLSPELRDLQERTRAFIRDEIVPLEGDKRQTRHGPSDDLRRELVARAAKHGLVAPHVGAEYGGLGLSHVGKAVVFEEAGYSLLGPLAMNIAAPDEGNMHLLEAVATAEQKDRWLRPLAAGQIRSCFCMSEPAPGAGSDPAALNTRAVQDGNHYVISGTKWFITGAEGAAFAIIMAAGEDGGATMFLADMDTPGIEIVRTMDSMDQGFPGGHAVVRLNEVRIPAGDVLGEPGKGFRYAQVRLAPARLTHCMRWLGAARRAHEIATDYARQREGFGKKLIEHEGVGFQLADNEIDIRLSRLAIWHTAWVLDQGERGGTESSMAKVACSEAIYRVADRSVQVLGGQGVTGETLAERIFREVRGFRIYDGPSEVHRWSLAQRIARHGSQLVTADLFDLSGRVAVVTGGGRGIGRFIAEGLAKHGARVVLTGRSRQTLDAAQQEMSSNGHDVLARAADVAREEDVIALRAGVLSDCGRIDVLVNNAGVNPIYKSIERTSLAEWQNIVDINLTGVFLCCKHLGGAMAERGGGSVINVSSVAGHVGLRRSVPYCASKGGVELLTRALALDWAAKRVRVNTIAPGYFETDLTAGLRDNDALAAPLLAHTPLGRFGKLEDVAGAAVFLASDASSYMTGSSLMVDGGWTAD